MHLNSWLIVSGVFVAIEVALVAYAWQLRHRRGGWPFLAYGLSALLWSLSKIVMVSGETLEVMTAATMVRSGAGMALAVACFAFVASMTGHGRWASGRRLILIGAIPAAVVALTPINPGGVVFREVQVAVVEGMSDLQFERGPAAVLSILYCYGLLAVALGMVLVAAVRAPASYRRQVAPLLAGILVPVVVHSLNVSGVLRSITLDPTASGVTVASLAFLWALLHDYLLDLTPIARATVFASMSDGVVVLDRTWKVVDLNPAAERILGRAKPEVVGLPGATVLSPTVCEAILQPGQPTTRWDLTLGEGASRRDYESRSSPLIDGGKQHVGWLVVLRDVTERKALERQLHHQAFHDTLTGLANRRMFLDRLSQALAGPDPEHVAVLLLDLDGFKGVNDRLGHQAGDEVLQAVARRLRNCARTEDLVARYGGDEFAVLLVGVERDEDVQRVGERLVVALREPFSIDGELVQIGGSVGYAFGFASARPDDLLQHADRALYAAKAAGKGCVVASAPGLEALTTVRTNGQLTSASPRHAVDDPSPSPRRR
jgi:diguanylate cyclase (GGDEF)-like protein/PAS domain S-box-containing protein